MKKNYQKFIFLFLGIIFLFAANYVFALEIDYNIPGLPTLNKDSSLPDYVRFIFAFLTYLAGAIAIISFAIGAVQFSMAAGSPSGAKEGKDRMIGSIIGLVLTLSAVIILRTINPSFTTPTITSLPTTDGVYYTNGSKYASAPTSDPDIENNGLEGFDKLTYKCSSGPAILVWTFKNKNLDYSEDAKTQRIECGDNESIDIGSSGSFKWAYESPGVYYCIGECEIGGCNGYMSEVNISSQDEIPSPFKGNIKSVRIVNDPDASVYYGFVLHKEIGLYNGGECTEAVLQDTKEWCEELPTTRDASTGKDVPMPAFAVDIFQWNKGKDSITSGSGVSLYSATYGWNPDIKSGEYNLTKEDLANADGDFLGTADEMRFNFLKSNDIQSVLCNEEYPACSDAYRKPNDYSNEELLYYFVSGNCCLCATPTDCLGSIRVNGDYFVGLYSYPENMISYCQTFTKNVENLDAYKYVLPGEDLTYIKIISTK